MKINPTIMIVSTAVIAVLMVFLFISGCVFNGNHITDHENLTVKAEKLVLSNPTVKASLINTKYSVEQITTPSINDTDWHLKVGYFNNSGLYKAPITIDDGSITGRSLVAIADTNDNKVLGIDFYSAKGLRLIPMQGRATISSTNYWYHEIGGNYEVQLITNITNVPTNYELVIIDESSLLKLLNDTNNNPNLTNIPQINYNLTIVNGTNFYDIIITNQSRRGIFLVVKNKDANKDINIDYSISPSSIAQPSIFTYT